MDLINIKPHRISYGVEGKHFLFYGPPSTRKTTVAMNFPNSLLLATEIGYQFIDGVRAVNIDSWYTFTQIVRDLKKQENKDAFDTIVIDTVGLLSDMCIKFICDKLNIEDLSGAGFGKGWTEYRKEFSRHINLIAQYGYGIVFIDHSKEERNDEGKPLSAKPKMDNTSSSIINALVDFTFFLNKEKSPEDDSVTVFAYTDLPSNIVTKSRAKNMPKRFEFNFENLEKELKNAVMMQAKEQNIEIDEDELAVSHKPLIPLGDPRSIEEIKDSIIVMGPQLVELGFQDRLQTILSNALGTVKLAQAQEVHKDQLLAIEQELRDLVEESDEQGDTGKPL